MSSLIESTPPPPHPEAFENQTSKPRHAIQEERSTRSIAELYLEMINTDPLMGTTTTRSLQHRIAPAPQEASLSSNMYDSLTYSSSEEEDLVSKIDGKTESQRPIIIKIPSTDSDSDTESQFLDITSIPSPDLRNIPKEHNYETDYLKKLKEWEERYLEITEPKQSNLLEFNQPREMTTEYVLESRYLTARYIKKCISSYKNSEDRWAFSLSPLTSEYKTEKFTVNRFHLRALPPFIFEHDIFERCYSVNLNHTELTRLPEFCYNLKKLKYLHLKFTSIEELPTYILDFNLEFICINFLLFNKLIEALNMFISLSTIEHSMITKKESRTVLLNLPTTCKVYYFGMTEDKKKLSIRLTVLKALIPDIKLPKFIF